MYEGYLSIGGTEIANAARFATYAQGLGVVTGITGCACPDLAGILADDDPYVKPSTDDAPWYDAATPASADFAGLWISEVTGISASTLSREVTASIGDGGVPGPPRDGERTVAVTGLLAAASEAGLSYGLAWLSAALRAGGDCAGGSCIGEELCFLGFCPAEAGDTEPELTATWEDAARVLYDAALVAGPTMTDKRHTGLIGCDSGQRSMIAQVEFTLVAGRPWVYQLPHAVASGVPFVADASEDCDITWVAVGAGRPPCPVTGCHAGPGCMHDPACPSTEPPAAPTPISGCACTSRFRSARTAPITAAPGVLPRWLDAVPIVTVTTGAAEMRRLTVRFYPNPTGGACTDLDECTACAEINLTYAPRDAVVIIDGRTERVTVTCPGGGVTPADEFVYGPGGAPFDWPAFECGAGLCVEVLVDADFYAVDAAVTVELAARQDAT